MTAEHTDIFRIKTTLDALEALLRPRDPRQERRLGNAHYSAQTTALDAFALLNGWKRTKRPGSNDLDLLGKGLAASHRDMWPAADLDRELMDHGHWFSAGRRFVAALGQPYFALDEIEETRADLAERGLALHVPPDPRASIHYPGATLFLVVTRPETPVTWLPEQDGRLGDLWEGGR
jgi:hypothetical protein